jgi:hypothetical protein
LRSSDSKTKRAIRLIGVFAITSVISLFLTGCGGTKSSTSPASSSLTPGATASPSTPASSSPTDSSGTTLPTSPPASTPAASSTPSAQAAFRFVSWGDSRDGNSTLASLSPQVLATNPALTLYPGDAESAGFTTAGTQSFVAALNGNNNNGLSTKTFFVRGNHDTGNTAAWQAYYNLANTASAVGATHYSALSSQLTYSFDYQNSHFVGMDVAGDANVITTAQISWLDGDLAAAETRGLTHAFIYFHGPVYCVESQHCPYTGTTGSYSPQALIDVFSKHPIVSAVIAGHEHLLAYIHLDTSRFPTLAHPIEQIITGSAGAPLYACNLPGRTDWCDSVSGFATVDVSGLQFTINYYQQGSTTALKTVQGSK